MRCEVRRVEGSPAAGDPARPPWRGADVAQVEHFRPEGSSHRPATAARALYDDTYLHVLFSVSDRYVLSTRTAYQSQVCRDACVECFLQPVAGAGYFNFEANCGGALLAMYIEDPARVGEGFAKAEKLPAAALEQVEVVPSMPAVVEPETEEPVTWTLRMAIPYAIMEPYTGPLRVRPGATWRGNFYKCAEDNSHPHWASWSPVHSLSFHLPECFGELRFV